MRWSDNLQVYISYIMIILNILSVFASPSVWDLKEIQIKNADEPDIRKRSAKYYIRKDSRTTNRIFSLINRLQYSLHIGKNFLDHSIVDGVWAIHEIVNGQRRCRNSTLFTIYELRVSQNAEKDEHQNILIRSFSDVPYALFICMNKEGKLYARPFRENWLPVDCVWENALSFHSYAHRYFPRQKKGKPRRKWYLAIDKNGNGMRGPATSFYSKESQWRLTQVCDNEMSKIHLRKKNIVIDGKNHSATPKSLKMSPECKELETVIQNEIHHDRVFSDEVLQSLNDIEARLVQLFVSFGTSRSRIKRFQMLFHKWIQMHWTLKSVRMKIARIKQTLKKFTKKLKVNRVRYLKKKYKKRLKKAKSRLIQRTKVLRRRKRQWNRVKRELTAMLQSIYYLRPPTKGRTRLHDYIAKIVHVKMYSISKIRLAVYLDHLRRRYENDTVHHQAVKFRQLRRRMRIIREQRQKQRDSSANLPFGVYFRSRRDLEPSRRFSEVLIRNWVVRHFPPSMSCIKEWKKKLRKRKRRDR